MDHPPFFLLEPGQQGANVAPASAPAPVDAGAAVGTIGVVHDATGRVLGLASSNMTRTGKLGGCSLICSWTRAGRFF